ncbi:MAG: hypothetical protein QOI92_1933 [Chloroflexota bacterium]|nr:hypothetical protein [Chloroflexota bacterium]
MRMRLLRGVGAAGALAIALIGVTAVPGVARASCAASPSLSPHGFTGTVIRVGADDRQAFVQKDDGTVVEVDGGALGPAISGEDFDFVLGARYQIEPENSKPPFLVNDCTATTRLGLTLATPSPSGPVATSAPVGLPSPIAAAPTSAGLTVFPTASAHPDFVSGVIFVLIFALLLVFAFAVRTLRRRRHRWD